MKLSSKKINRVPYGSLVRVDEINGQRCRISYPYRGWIQLSNISSKPCKYQQHMTYKQVRKLKVGDCIDHQNRGKFYAATVIKESRNKLKIHYDGSDERKDVWCDYKKQLYRFAERGSISKRPGSRLIGLKKGDYVNVNPMATHPELGWRCGEITEMDKNSGQIKVKYYTDYRSLNCYYYWVHLDNVKQVKEACFIACYKDNDGTKIEHRFPRGTIVSVEEYLWVRYRISEPCHGWIDIWKTWHVSTKEIKQNVRKRKIDYNGYFDEICFGTEYMKTQFMDIGMKSKLAQQIIVRFYKTVSKKEYMITKIESVKNKYFADRYNEAKKQMIKMMGKDDINEMNLWKGGRNQWIDKFSKQGLRKEWFRYNDRLQGIPLAVNAADSILINADKIIYAKVLCGESYSDAITKSKKMKLTEWPLKDDGILYDSLYHDDDKIYYIHDDVRVCPLYIIHYKGIAKVAVTKRFGFATKIDTYPTCNGKPEKRLEDIFGKPHRNRLLMKDVKNVWADECNILYSRIDFIPKCDVSNMVDRGFAFNQHNGCISLMTTDCIYVYKPLNGRGFVLHSEYKLPEECKLKGNDIKYARIRFLNDLIFVWSYDQSCVYSYKVGNDSIYLLNKYQDKYFKDSKTIDIAVTDELLILLFDRWCGIYKLYPKLEWYHAIAFAEKSVNCSSFEFCHCDDGKNNDNAKNHDGVIELREVNNNYIFVNAEKQLIGLHPANQTFDYLHIAKNVGKGNCKFCVSRKYGVFYLSDDGKKLYQSSHLEYQTVKELVDLSKNEDCSTGHGNVLFKDGIERFINLCYDECYGVSGRLLLFCKTEKSEYVMYHVLNYDEMSVFFEMDETGSTDKSFNLKGHVYNTLFGESCDSSLM